jgi:tRNA 2-selenouridine synthase
MQTPSIKQISIEDFLLNPIPLIDVRSPAEFEKGHIPGAVNIPLFSNEERARVGTVYVKQSREKAIELGLQLVAPKLKHFIDKAREVAPEGNVVVHCWRGGMRSKAFAQHLLDNGFMDVSIVEGGYKSYRSFVLRSFDFPFNLKIVGGYTGSGKTKVINTLQALGYQAIDLELLAKHKGSAFGWSENELQPTVEQFENNLFEAIRTFNFTEPIWLEDESHSIGSVYIPLNFFSRMRESEVYFLDVPKQERANLLVAEYANRNSEFLAEAIQKITNRLGGQNAKEALESLRLGRFYDVAIIALTYYDKAYLKSLSQHNSEKVYTIKSGTTNAIENTQLIIKHYSFNGSNQVNPI